MQLYLPECGERPFLRQHVFIRQRALLGLETAEVLVESTRFARDSERGQRLQARELVTGTPLGEGRTRR